MGLMYIIVAGSTFFRRQPPVRTWSRARLACGRLTRAETVQLRLTSAPGLASYTIHYILPFLGMGYTSILTKYTISPLCFCTQIFYFSSA